MFKLLDEWHHSWRLLRDSPALQPNSAEYLHLVVEALRLSFADTLWYTADPSQVTVPVETLLSKDYAAKRRALIDTSR